MRPTPAALRFVHVLGLLVLFALVWGSVGAPGHARVEPYYVLRNASGAELRPRVLIVLDTSTSMAWSHQVIGDVPPVDSPDCTWTECEQPGSPTESRISITRRVLRQAIERNRDQASWSLMTFDRTTPHTSMPGNCAGRRFQWVNNASTPNSTGAWPINLYPDVVGKWRLCSGNEIRPYPYLRWDNLGVGSVINADDQTGPLPPSPLISTSPADIQSTTNATRRVQWFPRFMGTRANLNETTDPGHFVLQGTYGDYGNDSNARYAGVYGQDFYYWPYVDGFPGYGVHSLTPNVAGLNRGGVSREDTAANHATLYTPFYLDLRTSNPSVPPDWWGPRNANVASQEVLHHMSPALAGGVDVDGGTPWASVIGDIPQWPPNDNRWYSHQTVASYLAFVRRVPQSGVCTPLISIMLTDGSPQPFATEGGPVLYRRLAALRDQLDVPIYMVGIYIDTSTAVNLMACAAAGACDGSCDSPCDDTPAKAWDTCRNPNSPATECAYMVFSPEQLATALGEILDDFAGIEVPTGPSADLSDYGDWGDNPKQTRLTAQTEYPGWRGHLERTYCTNRVDTNDDGVADALAPECTPNDETMLPEETWGPCPQGRAWDAGVCLQQTAWRSRRLYTNLTDGRVIPLTESDGETASDDFVAELQRLGVITGFDLQDQADRLARFIKGEGWPEGWKLPGLANAAPVVIRRVPRYRPNQLPSVNIRDPHCAGRRLTGLGDFQLPESLTEFARAAWPYDTGGPTVRDYEYQEAVIIGDDLGVLHAFQYDSGNELWGFIPNFALAGAERQRRYGPANRGQPASVEAHEYGLGGTGNQAWVFDPAADRWRHLLVIGMGRGGGEYMALDVSHMNPGSSRGPFEVLWTTEYAALKDTYDAWLGETWARPAISYRVTTVGSEPQAVVLLGSGYRRNIAATSQGRVLALVNALTGVPIEWAFLPGPTQSMYGGDFGVDYGSLVDPAVATNCESRFWAEMEEVYVPDPAGRVFRWDLGGSNADSGAEWPPNGTAVPDIRFWACEGSGNECHPNPSNRGDPFVYGAAVTTNNRIDDAVDVATGTVSGVDESLVALISGSLNDPLLDGKQLDNAFHSSLYLLVDEHDANPHAGFKVQSNQPKMVLNEIGNYRDYLRMALSDVPRTRRFVPYPGAAMITETRNFSRMTRPIRAPRIRVSGIVRDTSGGDAERQLEVVDGLEVYDVSYFVYEPASQVCDMRFYDSATRTWHPDHGDAFEITFRLTSTTGAGFNFGFTDEDSNYFGDGFAEMLAGTGLGRELTFTGVKQMNTADCETGNCGLHAQTPMHRPCAPDPGAGGQTTPFGLALPLSSRPVVGFTPFD